MMSFRTRRQRAGIAAAAVIAAVLVSGCSNFNLRREMGLVGNGPDEFRVVTNERLKMPEAMPAKPDELPEPKPGAPSLVEPTPERDAQALLNMQSVEAKQASPSEQALLQRAGAAGASDNIRGELEQDAAAAQDDLRILDELLGNKPEEVDALDPTEEARRLAQQAQQGKNPELELPPEPSK